MSDELVILYAACRVVVPPELRVRAASDPDKLWVKANGPRGIELYVSVGRPPAPVPEWAWRRTCEAAAAVMVERLTESSRRVIHA